MEEMEMDSIECVSSSMDGVDDEEIHASHQYPKPNNNVGIVPTSVHELLECPVCTNSMYPPIHQIVIIVFRQWFKYISGMNLVTQKTMFALGHRRTYVGLLSGLNYFIGQCLDLELSFLGHEFGIRLYDAIMNISLFIKEAGKVI
ncbi:E3 ubiquitin-protein ligase SINAT3 [Capsicum chinense]|nr:E3 ubiquitin-protein ligase SINAT3 [Capsicum chinense]